MRGLEIILFVKNVLYSLYLGFCLRTINYTDVFKYIFPFNLNVDIINIWLTLYIILKH